MPPGYGEFTPLADGRQTTMVIDDIGLTGVRSYFNCYAEFRTGVDVEDGFVTNLGRERC